MCCKDPSRWRWMSQKSALLDLKKLNDAQMFSQSELKILDDKDINYTINILCDNWYKSKHMCAFKIEFKIWNSETENTECQKVISIHQKHLSIPAVRCLNAIRRKLMFGLSKNYERIASSLRFLLLITWIVHPLKRFDYFLLIWNDRLGGLLRNHIIFLLLLSRVL